MLNNGSLGDDLFHSHDSRGIETAMFTWNGNGNSRRGRGGKFRGRNSGGRGFVGRGFVRGDKHYDKANPKSGDAKYNVQNPINKSKEQNDEKKFCPICLTMGYKRNNHKAADCRNAKKIVETAKMVNELNGNTNFDNQYLLSCVSTNNSSNSDILDSGATSIYINNIERFAETHSGDKFLIQTADGSLSTSSGIIGTVGNITEVNYTPEFMFQSTMIV